MASVDLLNAGLPQNLFVKNKKTNHIIYEVK